MSIQKTVMTHTISRQANPISRRNLLKGIGIAVAGLAGMPTVGCFESDATDITPRATIPGIASDSGTNTSEDTTGAMSPTATPTVEATPTPKPKDPTTIKAAANRLGLHVGVFMSNTYPEALEIMANDFNYGQIYVGWPYSEANRGQFDTTSLRVFTNFAEQNGFSTQAGMLVWPSDVPQWVTSGGFSKEELIGVLDQHITGLMTPFKGKVSDWLVVNEPYNPPYITNDIFYQTIGPDYITLCFQIARIADPSALLIYNAAENHFEAGVSTKRTREDTQRLKDKALIDGVGLQMHLNGAHLPDSADIIATMQSYGLPVYITELDVNMKDVQGGNEQRFALQADAYRTVIEAARKAGVVNAITIFGISDQDSVWETHPTLKDYSPNADSLLFDDNFKRKPAYDAVLEALS